MKVYVKLFAAAKDVVGSDAITIQVADGATIAEVREALVMATPGLANIVAHALWAVDTEYAAETTPITTKSEIALIPPVSGG